MEPAGIHADQLSISFSFSQTFLVSKQESCGVRATEILEAALPRRQPPSHRKSPGNQDNTDAQIQ